MWNLILFQVYIVETILFCIKKNCDLGAMPYYLWKIASVEEIWTLVNCISWCLTDHMTNRTKFVNRVARFWRSQGEVKDFRKNPHQSGSFNWKLQWFECISFCMALTFHFSVPGTSKFQFSGLKYFICIF